MRIDLTQEEIDVVRELADEFDKDIEAEVCRDVGASTGFGTTKVRTLRESIFYKCIDAERKAES